MNSISQWILIAGVVLGADGESSLESGPTIGEKVPYNLNIERVVGERLRVGDDRTVLGGLPGIQ